MSVLKAKALYDFQGDASMNELSFKTGDEITILRQDIGEGWWEGQLAGKIGLFPETYVELGADAAAVDSDDWDEEGDEEWDDGGGASAAHGSAGASADPSDPAESSTDYHAASGSTYTAGNTVGKATLKRSVNRCGAESYMIGGLKDLTVDQSKTIHLAMTAEGLSWAPNPAPYVGVSVSHAGKRSKFKGIKSFEAYAIQGGAPNNGSVERRHKHFVWLYERLRDKYSCLCVPPLPDKQFMSKYGENELNKRQAKLQQWLLRVCRHPVLARDQLSLKHFLCYSASDEKGWKIGKRQAEKDDFVGGQFFKLISQDAQCPKNSDKEIEAFANTIKDMSTIVRKNQDIALHHADRMLTGFRREYKRIAEGMNELGTTFSQGNQANGDSIKLSMALVKCGQTYESIAAMWAEQPPNDQIPLFDGLKEYVGLLNQFHDAISSCRAASQKVSEIEVSETAKEDEKALVAARRDIIHSLTLCEVAHFHKQRREDFRDLMKAYLSAQIQFHEKIAEKLRQARAEFEKLTY